MVLVASVSIYMVFGFESLASSSVSFYFNI